jgi:hypothetical protein
MEMISGKRKAKRNVILQAIISNSCEFTGFFCRIIANK